MLARGKDSLCLTVSFTACPRGLLCGPSCVCLVLIRPFRTLQEPSSDPEAQVRMVRAQMSRAACYTLLSHAVRHTRESHCTFPLEGAVVCCFVLQPNPVS